MQQPRKQKKALKEAFQNRDPEAARLLLAHSTALGHERLAVRRYFAAKYLGSSDLGAYRSFCRTAARCFKPQELLNSAVTVARELHLPADVHDAVSDLIPAHDPLILPYADTWPALKGAPRYCGALVSLLGRLEIGADPWLGPRAVVRGDGHFVRIGDDFRLGERSTVHISHDRYPVIVGDRVTVGRNAVVHACTVGDDCVIEDGVVILDGSTIEDGAVIEANSTVYPRSVLKRGWLHAGRPARAVRPIDAQERAARATAVSNSIFASIAGVQPDMPAGEIHPNADGFVAATAVLQGAVGIGPGSGIFFGCRLQGGDAGIAIGRDCNIQDNSVIDASRGTVVIGDRTTIGHNVHLSPCTIGDDALIGIGSIVGEGTVIESNVLLAASAITVPGQRLESGWVWAGCPAEPITKLDDAKRAMLSGTVAHYRAYGAQYAHAQTSAANESSKNPILNFPIRLAIRPRAQA